ncbi:hypothetical protein [Roseomonas sp. USHLN139]|uniref:hypothetical protein n=1 Tax=Roseomonas sp. USHLN139 TaxID=3081298 RepID=UPI003B012DAA
MAQSLLPEVDLLLRIGPRRLPELPPIVERVNLGSKVTVWCDVRDRATGEPVDIGPMACFYHRPELSDFLTQDVPLFPTRIGVGIHRADFVPEMPGEFTVWWGAPNAPMTSRVQFEVGDGF